jgi:hypothetical protein
MQNFGAAISSSKSTEVRHTARFVLLFTLAIAAVAMLVTASHATGSVGKADLNGPWSLSMTGNTGCGLAAMQATFSLNNGTGTASITTHGQCGDSVLTGQAFTIATISANGSGTANLACGVGCGWNFNIQVSPDRSTFSVVDVAAANPNNYLSGVAIHQ